MGNKLIFDISADEMEIFLEDVNECLQAMESGLLHLEQQHDTETLNSIFRAAHTLKALAGTVGHHQMADVTHTLENIFDEMRQAKLSPTQAVADELFAVVDVYQAYDNRHQVFFGQNPLQLLRRETESPVEFIAAHFPQIIPPGRKE